MTKKDMTQEEYLKVTQGMNDLLNSTDNQPRWVDKIKSAVVPFLFAGQVAQANIPPLQSVQTPSHVERIMNGNKNTSELDAFRVKQQIAGLSQFRTKIGSSDIYGALEYSQRGALLK